MTINNDTRNKDSENFDLVSSVFLNGQSGSKKRPRRNVALLAMLLGLSGSVVVTRYSLKYNNNHRLHSLLQSQLVRT